MPIWGILLIIVGFCVVFPAFWSLVVLLIGQMSGWSRLGRQFRSETPVVGLGVGFMRMGWSKYSHVAVAEGRPEGLALSVFGLFRPGHPPLCIPWSEVRYVGPFTMFPMWKGVHLELGPYRVRLLFPDAAWAAVGGAERLGMR